MDDENKYQAPLKLTSAKHNRIDLELTIDPAPPSPRGNSRNYMIFLYLMVCSIQKKMIAQFCWGFTELWAFKIRYHLKKCSFFCIFNTHASSYFNTQNIY